MGLGIHFYKNVTPSGPVITDPDELEEAQCCTSIGDEFFFPNSHFPGRSGDIVKGQKYLAEDAGCFRAGSYGGYSVWRNQLTKMCEYEIEYTDDFSIEEASNKPFFELVWFSDCEGVLGTQVCKKLAKDFADFQEKANHAYTDDYIRPGNFLRLYNEFRNAFEIAGNHNGLVAFG